MRIRNAARLGLAVGLFAVGAPVSAQVALDPSFGNGGVATTFPGHFVSGVSLALQEDGRILQAGFFYEEAGDLAVARLLPDGTLDSSFGTGGVARAFEGWDSDTAAVAVQADGRVLLGGYANDSGASSVARFLPDGTLDPSFGDGGIAQTFPADPFAGTSIAVQDDGRILFAASRGVSPFDYSVARLLADGTLDPGFGDGGIAAAFAFVPDIEVALALQSDGRILVAGMNGDEPSYYNVARLLADGGLDPDFGVGGIAEAPFGALRRGPSLAIDQDGRILLGGFTFLSHGFALTRFLPDGQVDLAFGDDGVATTFVSETEGRASVALQQDGRILLGAPRMEPPYMYAVTRFLADGSLDATFGPDGVAETFSGWYDGQLSLAVQGDGRILLAGIEMSPLDYGVARLAGPVAFADRVWIDGDADGLQDAGEPGAPGVRVVLRDLDTAAVVDEDLTDGDGLFAVSSASFVRAALEFEPDPTSPYSTFTRHRIGGDSNLDSDALASGATPALAASIGAERTDIDAGLLPPDLIGDFLWIDADGDGLQDPEEAGAAPLAVQLLDAADQPLATVLVSPFGHYAFAGWPAATYRLRLVVPPGLGLTLNDQGGLDELDSDFAPATGLSPPVVYAGGFQMSIDGGLLASPGWIFSDGFETGSTIIWSAATL